MIVRIHTMSKKNAPHLKTWVYANPYGCRNPLSTLHLSVSTLDESPAECHTYISAVAASTLLLTYKTITLAAQALSPVLCFATYHTKSLFHLRV